MLTGTAAIPLIINQAAGRKSRFAIGLEKLLIRSPLMRDIPYYRSGMIQKLLNQAFQNRGLDPQTYLTHRPGDANKIAKRLAEEKEPVIVVAGGDGTINEVVNALVGTGTALGIIPLGTANTFATELGIPFSVEKACRIIQEGRIRTMDVGRAGEHFFVIGAGIGFDAGVIRKITPDFKYRLGSLAYILKGISESFTYPFPILHVESEDRQGSGYLVIVANTRFYGGFFKAAPQASLNDGLLDVVIFKRKRLSNLLFYLFQMRRGDVTRLPDVEHFQCRKLRVTSDSPVWIHLDAEVKDAAPCEFECVPDSLRVIVP